MKVLVCDPIDKESVEGLKKIPGFTVEVKTGMTKEELIKVVPDYNVLIVRSATKVTKEVIEAGKNLKIVLRGGVGMDNIDIPAAKAKNITVDNTPEASSISVAELTLGMMLSMARKLHVADASTKQSKWEKKKFEGSELYQKTLGLIGIGRIGSEVAKRCQAFGMSVIAYDPYIKPDMAKQMNVTLTSNLDELYSKADYISLHIPLTKETTNMLSTAQFEKMKNGVRIVNCARGGIIDETALANAIKAGKVAGVALDVYSQEPVPADSPLLKLEQCLLTPHVGASTFEGQARVGGALVKKLKDLTGKN
ncbi:MAG: phosphoglycerate dehydrogenase [Planctomycetes bacterium]|nr:phosphoglycerate dehydrogenase [Planctomycetota bacterium]